MINKCYYDPAESGMVLCQDLVQIKMGDFT